jgi:acyl-CoA reductase-like NAD-dependent aldehyde dehydrogenase
VIEPASGDAVHRRSPAHYGLVASVIDGAPVPSGKTAPSTNPARLDEVVGEVSVGDASTFVRAAESAKKAQESWAAIPAPVRGRAIAHIGRLIEDNAEALARLVTAEIGKPYGEALGEVREIIDTCDFFSVRVDDCTDRPCPARCRTSSCSPFAGRWAPSP